MMHICLRSRALQLKIKKQFQKLNPKTPSDGNCVDIEKFKKKDLKQKLFKKQ